MVQEKQKQMVRYNAMVFGLSKIIKREKNMHIEVQKVSENIRKYANERICNIKEMISQGHRRKSKR